MATIAALLAAIGGAAAAGAGAIGSGAAAAGGALAGGAGALGKGALMGAKLLGSGAAKGAGTLGTRVAQTASGTKLGLQGQASGLMGKLGSLQGMGGSGSGPFGNPLDKIVGMGKDVNLPSGTIAGSGGGNPLQGFFDMLGGTNVQSTGKIGEIARAQKMSSMGPFGKLRSFGAQQLQSGLGDMAKNAISQGIGGGGGGGQPAQAGGINFPSVPGPAQPISLPPLPEYNMPSTEDISGLRAQILQEILQQGGGF